MTAFVVIFSLAAVLGAAPAHADGDPASDVLATQPVFLPQDAGIPAGAQTQLAALLKTAQRNRHPIRVAVIATPADLGSITQLWRRPQTYARFLGEELSLTYRGPLLVIMPNGFGLSGFSGSLARAARALSGIRPSQRGAQLGTTAISAVERLAAASGHPLRPPANASAAAPTAASANPIAWLVLAIGALIIAAAWTASIRTRPLRLAGGRVHSE